jgi:hypothetical protein
MSSQPDPHAFGKFVPGFDFLQKLAQGGTASMASWVAPTLDAQALDKRIDELKAVQFWLDQNAAALKATIQALEVQKMTLATLRSMNMVMPTATAAAQPAAPEAPAAPHKPRAKAPPQTTAAVPPASMADPMQYWGALTRQFQQIAGDAMKDLAARSGQAPAKGRAAAPGAAATPPAAKTAPRSRRKAAG